MANPHHRPEHTPDIRKFLAREGYRHKHKKPLDDATLALLTEAELNHYAGVGQKWLAVIDLMDKLWGVFISVAMIGLLFWVGSQTYWFGFRAPKPSPTPTPVVQPANGTLCADGWISQSSGPGTCSHHGGEAH